MIRKHGKSRAKIQRYYCGNCKSTFQTKYIYMHNKIDKKNEIDGYKHNITIKAYS